MRIGTHLILKKNESNKKKKKKRKKNGSVVSVSVISVNVCGSLHLAGNSSSVVTHSP